MTKQKLYKDPELTRILSLYVGENFQNYINKFRIIDAKRQIICGEKAITDILYTVGFSGVSTFNTAFKNTMGITPSEFKKNVQTKEQTRNFKIL